MEAMTSEREAFEAAVRQWPNYSERTLARDGRYPEYYGSHVVQGAWEGWKARARLAQPAQAVDVGAIRGVIDALNAWDATGWRTLKGHAETLTRALSGEKAGPVGDGYVLIEREFIESADAALGLSTIDGEHWTEHESPRFELRMALGLSREKPASPTPDKEGEG